MHILNKQNEILDSNNLKIIESIKLLLYKKNNKIFDYIDFENDNIYLEPLLFSYFCNNNNYNNNNNIYSIISGYSKILENNIKINTDKFGRIYLPNLGWFLTEKINSEVNIKIGTDYKITCYGKLIEFKFEQILKIANSNIELIKYPIPLLDQFFYDINHNIVEVEIENATKKHLFNLNNAMIFFEKYLPLQYNYINKHTKKIVIFNNQHRERNSFATFSAHGIAFLNTYQNDYGLIYFIDDIAHQTGHIIFEKLLYNRLEYFKISEKNLIDENNEDRRTIESYFHGLFTYYTTFLALDGVLENRIEFNLFEQHEALGRMCFYIAKCINDLKLLDENTNKNIRTESILTDLGIELYIDFKSTLKYVYDKYYTEIKEFRLTNQPYNFTYEKFAILNPIT